MRNVFKHLLAATALLCGLVSALAQTQPAQSPPTASQAAPSLAQAPEPPQDRPDSLVESIRHEDAGSRIDELRVGGVVRRITVQPKGGNMPAYDVVPESARQTGHPGSRGWTILGF